MATINLAPGAQYLAVIRRRRRFLFGTTSVVLLVTVLAWLGAYVYVKSIEGQIAGAQTELQDLETRLAALKPDLDRIALFEGRLTALQVLLENHISWIPLLSEIEKLLPPPTVFASLAVSQESGSVEVSGTAPDIDQIAQALASLTAARQPEQLFTSGQITSVTRAQAAGAEGQPGTIRYGFSAKLFFDAQRLQAGNISNR